MNAYKKNGRILIVDDDSISLTILGNALQGEYEIIVATTGEEALAISGGEEKPELILLDIKMPGIDGYEVCRRLKNVPDTAEIPIIFMTSLSSEEDEMKGFACGAVDYIIKPFSLNRIKARLKLHLELKHNRDLLAKSLLKNRLILEAVGEGIFGVNREGVITFVNPAALKMTGFAAVELIGADAYRLLHHTREDRRPYPRQECPITKTCQDGQIRNQTGEVFWRKDGSSFPVDYVVTPLKSMQSRMGAVVVFNDVSRRLQLEQEALKLQKFEAIGILAGGIAHDFNNVLTGVIGYIELCRKCSNEPEAVMHLLDLAHEASAKAVELARKLLTFSEGGHPIKTELDLAQILTKYKQMVFTDQKYELQVDIAPDLWPVYADEVQLSQVILNLLDNARESMPDGGLIQITAQNCASGRKENSALEDRKYLRFNIIDQGSGIPAKIMPNIFDPYFSSKCRASQKAMGLGLPICLSIIKKHHGLITVESSLGKGTTVSIYLPAE